MNTMRVWLSYNFCFGSWDFFLIIHYFYSQLFFYENNCRCFRKFKKDLNENCKNLWLIWKSLTFKQQIQVVTHSHKQAKHSITRNQNWLLGAPNVQSVTMSTMRVWLLRFSVLALEISFWLSFFTIHQYVLHESIYRQ